MPEIADHVVRPDRHFTGTAGAVFGDAPARRSRKDGRRTPVDHAVVCPKIESVSASGRPGVDWTTVEAYIARSQVRSVDKGPRPLADASLDLCGESFSWMGSSPASAGPTANWAASSAWRGRLCPGAGGAVSLNSKRAVCAGGPGSRSTSRPRAGLDIDAKDGHVGSECRIGWWW